MKASNQTDILISGVGVTSSIGQGLKAFTEALLSGRSNFSVMRRPGRQHAFSQNQLVNSLNLAAPFIGAEIDGFTMPESMLEFNFRQTSLSARLALATMSEAWSDAKLEGFDSSRIGLIVGGSNFQQRELVNTYDSYREKAHYLTPSYAMSFLDSDVCGLCSEVFGINGPAYTLGGASASSLVALIQAKQAIEAGQVDICLVLGPLMDLSYWECQAFRAIGAMGGDAFVDKPELACRPFDRDRNGFVFGESCGVVVLERDSGRVSSPYARLTGTALVWDGNRNPNPSLSGEVEVIARALDSAGLAAIDIDYVNPHGTGSILGDEIEVEALTQSGLTGAYINSSKSIIGHGLCSAGIVELIATLVQMKARALHPSNNLVNPMCSALNWVTKKQAAIDISHALKLSMGFGGVNSAVCLTSVN